MKRAIENRKGAPAGNTLLPSFNWFWSIELSSVSVAAVEERRQYWRAFQPHGIEGIRIEAQDFQNRGSHLSGLHKAVNGAGLDAGVGNQQHHVGIVMREAAVLGLLLQISGVDHAHVRNY